MNNYLSSWAISVAVAIIFSAIVSAILPETSIKKYVSVVLGIVVMLIMLSPLFKLFSGVDFQQEVDSTFEGITQVGEYEYDSSLYKDYIFEVYMGDD